MPDSPAPTQTEVIPSVSSPGNIHIVTSAPLADGRTAISTAAGIPNGFHPASPNQPLSPGLPGLLNGMQLPPTCGARQLSKLKRFLTTLQQFGSDISPEIGERVRSLIVNLVNNVITVEDFHQQLQDATNFPLRPFVIPFLKTNLPLLQQELLQCAHLAKRSPHQYMSSGEPLTAHDRERIKLENEELFGRDLPVGEKRKADERPRENGHHHDPMGLSPNKRKCTTPGGFTVDGSAFAERLMEGMKRESDDWRNIETMLQCVMTIFDKAKRAISNLQERCIQDREEMAAWARAMAVDAEAEVKRRAADLMAKTLKQTDDRVSEVKRRAEEAVTDVKRQAVVELQKAVCAAEEKANEALSQAQARMDKAVEEARRQATEETSCLINKQESSKEHCWNCGRKANETCSGCNVARYCGSFCQHKDWESVHHKDCGKQAKLSPVTEQQPLVPKSKSPTSDRPLSASSLDQKSGSDQSTTAESSPILTVATTNETTDPIVSLSDYVQKTETAS